MKLHWIALAACVMLAAACSRVEQKPVAVNPNKTSAAVVEDPYLWLEETDSAMALDWVKARNAESVKAYGSSPEFDKTRDAILEVPDETSLEQSMTVLLSTPLEAAAMARRAQEVVRREQGATERHMRTIVSLLQPSASAPARTPTVAAT